MDSSTLAIGIDLGTTHCCVAYINSDGEIVVLKNDCGDYTTPSIVAYTDDKIIVGRNAKSQASINPTNTIYDTKRLIGRKFDDEIVQKDMKNWPFKIIDIENKPMIEVTHGGRKELLHAEQIQARILTELRRIAEKYLDSDANLDAVITVPAAFNDGQRQATIDAGTIAGLNVLQIINEPTAAAMAYGYDKKISNGEYILVYDLGGGTFDVTILKIENEIYTVRGSMGDLRLGGQDFDSIILDSLVEKINEKTGKDLRQNPKAISRLRKECENAKIELSSAEIATVSINSLFENFDCKETVTKAFFERQCKDLFQKSIRIVKECLKKAKLEASEINEIVLVGGSSRIPKIQDLLRNTFRGKSLQFSIHPDHAIAYGAAIQAGIIKSNLYAIILHDVANSSLGIETVGGVMSTIIEKNTDIPCLNGRNYTTVKKNQSEILIKVYEGENKKTEDNDLLGKFTVKITKLQPKGVPNIKVSFKIDTNGILTVSAEDTTGGKVEVIDNKERLTLTQVFDLQSKHKNE